MSEKSPDTLELTQAHFLAVLAQWDSYVRVYLKHVAREMAAWSDDEWGQYPIPATDGRLTRVNLNELGDALWESLSDSPEQVAELHGRLYADEQVAHFVNCYLKPDMDDDAKIKELAEQSQEDGYLMPSDMFILLGLPAQLTLVREGHFQKAVFNMKEVEVFLAAREDARARAEERQREERRLAREARKKNHRD